MSYCEVCLETRPCGGTGNDTPIGLSSSMEKLYGLGFPSDSSLVYSSLSFPAVLIAVFRAGIRSISSDPCNVLPREVLPLISRRSRSLIVYSSGASNRLRRHQVKDHESEKVLQGRRQTANTRTRCSLNPPERFLSRPRMQEGLHRIAVSSTGRLAASLLTLDEDVLRMSTPTKLFNKSRKIPATKILCLPTKSN